MKDLQTKDMLLQGPIKDGLDVLPIQPNKSIQPSVFLGERTSTQQWHACLGQPSSRITALTLCRFQLLVDHKASTHTCAACSQAKAHVLPHLPSPSRSSKPFQLLFLDVWGPAPMLSSNG